MKQEVAKKKRYAEQVVRWLKANCSNMTREDMIDQGAAYAMGAFLTDARISREIARMAVTRLELIKAGALPDSMMTDGERITGYGYAYDAVLTKEAKKVTEKDLKKGWGNVAVVEEE